MKVVLVIVEDEDATLLINALIQQNIDATKLTSSGGFLQRGNTTLLVGVQDEQVEQVIETSRRTCGRRKTLLPSTSTAVPVSATMPVEITVGGGIMCVLDVSSNHKV